MSKQVPDDFAPSDEEAANRFAATQEMDPFPDIAPALLNNSDIIRYVKATGMLFPFYADDDHLKPASYEVAIAGPYVFWDETGARQSDTIDIDKPFTLQANSIAFVTLEPYFRIPTYIALRFNLRITHIYRGILLGTGPLVDPGFQGKLSMPLHNLTINPYQLLGGEGLIWMEFTKVSPRRRGDEAPGGRLPENKINLSLDAYLHKAADGLAVRSSLPKLVDEAAQAALRAADSSQRSEEATRTTGNFLTTALLVAVVLGFVTAVAAVTAILSLVNGTNARFDQLAAQLRRGTPSPSVASNSLAALNSRVTALGSQFTLAIWIGGGVLLAIVVGWFVFNVWRRRQLPE